MLQRPAFGLPIRIASLALLLLCSAFSSAQSSPDTGDIVGQIRVARIGFPAERIRVTLTTRGATVNQVWTDDEGRFAFFNLPSNTYHLVIDDERYEPLREDVRLNPTVVRTNVVSVTLTPKAPDKPPVPDAQVPGSNPYMVDPAAYKRQFPKKVVSEFEKGVKEQEKGKLEPAIKHFQAAIALAPDFYPAHNNLGTAYLGQGNLAGAETEFKTAMGQNQSDTQAYFNLGNVYLLTGRTPDAQRVIEEGLKRQPDAALGHFLFGTVLARTGRQQDGEKELRKAEELDPLLSRVHLELVNVYLQQHKTIAAVAELRMFLRRFPSDPLAPRAREVLAHLEGPPAQK